MKLLKYILSLLILTTSIPYSMQYNNGMEEIKKKKKKKGKKLKNKAKGKKWGIFKAKWKKEKKNG